MKTLPDELREWLRGALMKTGMKPSHLAARANINSSTLYRFLNKDGGEGHVLSTRTIRKIEAVLGEFSGEDAQGKRLGLSEGAAALFDVDGAAGGVAAAVRALIGNRNAADPWEMLNDDLAGIGLFKGDVVVVDLNEPAQPGDIVCAQLYEAAGVKTVFRLYEPPYLISGSSDPALRRPIVVDNTNAVIRGTVIGKFSPRRTTRRAA